MKTKNKDKISKANELLKLVSSRKQNEKRESELKEYFKNEIKDGVLECGNVTIIILDAKKSSLDRKGLEQEFGLEAVKAFEKITEYKKVEVRGVK